MKNLSSIILLALCAFFFAQSTQCSRQPALFKKNHTTYIYIDPNEKQVVHTAVSLLQKDVQAVFNARLQPTDNREQAQIIVSDANERSYTSGESSPNKPESQWEAFQMDVRNKKLFITGSDARGKAYGILELSRLIGVSPWEWWADATPEKRTRFVLPDDYKNQQSPSVQYRGIFLNDEDWGLLPWATENFDWELIPGVKLSDNPRWKGAIGPECYERIFQLLLRLRANTIWPAMHECTVPFYFVKGNREMADKYGIVVGTSHCEPLMRNSASEWDVGGKGNYNFITNRQNVLNYWTDRLNELQHSENIFTIGMRGKHDGVMQGVKTLDEHTSALSQIIPTQQELLRKHIHPQIEEIPQIFIPYKEVLDVYNNGLDIPDHVTLVWCDDNYGYIRRLSNPKEQLRSGGAGVYYHVSYWGRPHDYLWLASTSPALIYTEMKRAYEHNAKKLWILNVGDIKPAEYLTEFFLDMAWNIDILTAAATESPSSIRNVFSHLENWTERAFGKQPSGAITSVMKEYYRLANIRKPEFAAWSRVEEYEHFGNGLSPATNSEYHPTFNNELQQRIDDYLALEQQINVIRQTLPANKTALFFQWVEYPVRGASLLNQKWLYRQLSDYAAKMGDVEKAQQLAAKSLNAHHSIQQITDAYNRLDTGKWNPIMHSHPRNLPVFAQPEFPFLDLQAEQYAPSQPTYVSARNASQADNLPADGSIIEGLGHSFSAVAMKPGQVLHFSFEVPEAGDYTLQIGTVPNHDGDGEEMKLEIFLNHQLVDQQILGASPRSEAWKQNVLRGQALTSTRLTIDRSGPAILSIKALSPSIILDQLMLLQGDMNFYEFPVKTTATPSYTHETHPLAWAGNSINAVIFRKNALVTHGRVQYMAYYDTTGHLCLAQREDACEIWKVHRTQHQGNIYDAHNTISIMTDGEGFLHACWNHHNSPLSYARSSAPLALDLGDKQTMTDRLDRHVTYPEFHKLPNGNLIFLFRDGESGKGNLVINQYHTQTGRWTRLHNNLIDGEGQRNAYWQACIDPLGTIHLAWVWRETPDVASNHDMCYARSADGGLTWENTHGQPYRIPITAADAEYVCRIPSNSELINQTSITTDRAGRPYIATYYREADSDIPQYHIFRHTGTDWQTVNTAFRRTAFTLRGAGTKSIPISRPQVVVADGEGRQEVVLLFRDAERGRKVSVATCTDLAANRWEIADLTASTVGDWEPTYDTELWKDQQILQLYVQYVDQIDGEGISDTSSKPIRVITVPLAAKPINSNP
jgi:hypothetical protein